MVARALARLDDMLVAAQIIEDLVSDGRPSNRVEMLALERALEILSEASRHIPAALNAEYPTTAWQKIADLGNVLRHEYWHLDPTIILDIAKRHVPGLPPILRAMIERLERDDAAANAR